MRTKLAIVILLFGFIACTEPSDRPKELIPVPKMALVLRDIHEAEQRVSQLSLRGQDSAMVVYDALETRILKKYSVDTSAYRKSYYYYTAHPDLYQQIYTIVIDSLQADEKRGQKLTVPPSKTAKADSAKKTSSNK